MKSHRRYVSAALTLILSLVALGPLPSTAAATPSGGNGEIVALDHEASGQAAIDELGVALTLVANAHGKSASELARALRDDKTLHVDTRGRLVYKEAPLSAEAATLAAPAS
jgi:predicted secreted protein